MEQANYRYYTQEQLLKFLILDKGEYVTQHTHYPELVAYIIFERHLDDGYLITRKSYRQDITD